MSLKLIKLNNSKINYLTANDWDILENLKDLLKIFYNITVEISAEKYITISKAIIFVNHSVKYTQRFTNNVISL